MPKPTEGDILDFLYSCFQMHSPDMGGNHCYRFRNGGWPMTHLKGPNIREAVANAMQEASKEKTT